MKRVVVTGLGIVSPLGNSTEDNWANALAGKSGIDLITQLNLEGEPVQIGGEVKKFDPTLWMSEKDVRRNQKFVQFAIAASKMAMKDSNYHINSNNSTRCGVSIGVGVGGLDYFEQQIFIMREKGSKWVSPFTIPGFIANMAAGIVSQEVGAKGPNLCPTTACASGTHAIGEALMLIQTGRADMMIAGGAESCLSYTAFSGFSRMKALCSKFNHDPKSASRPFDKDRCGFVMGEGAGVLILEEYEFAKARGAKIYCELAGYGLTSDAYHMTSPSPDGDGAIRAMQQALETGGLKPTDIHYINAHGTSTEANDATETKAIKGCFGAYSHEVSISSTKGMTGHLLGAAGGVEAIFTVLSMRDSVIPPTINLLNPDPDCDLNYTPLVSQKRTIHAAISNSFGFGGTNACIAFKKL